MTVFPYPAGDPMAAARYAADLDAVVGVGRRQAGPGQFSLSPRSLQGSEDLPGRLVLPSPNGSAICWQLTRGGVACVGACLRNATVVAAWICSRRPAIVTVIAAGERWSDVSLRPAAEDLLGAGAVISALVGRSLAGGRTGLARLPGRAGQGARCRGGHGERQGTDRARLPRRRDRRCRTGRELVGPSATQRPRLRRRPPRGRPVVSGSDGSFNPNARWQFPPNPPLPR